jgi:hypothetical protein
MPRIPHLSTKNRVPVTIALLVVPLACLGLGACGSSSSGSSSSASTPTAAHTTAEAPPTTPASTTPASTTPTSTTPTSTEPSIRSSHQVLLIYNCMRRNGIKLPPLAELSKAKVDTTSPHYVSTLAKCRHAVLG